MTTVESPAVPAVATRPSRDLDDTTVRAFLRGALEPGALGEPAWGPIGREVFERTYARDLGERRETWAETCRRVVNGSLSYIDRSLWLQDEDVELFRALFTFAALPAGRHLWVTGTDLSHMSKNCFSAGHSTEPTDHFRFLAARLFEGGGVGSNYSADLLAGLPPVVGGIALSVWCRQDHHDIEQVRAAAGGALSAWSDSADDAAGAVAIVVEDTREGWVDAWMEVIGLAHKPGIHRVFLDVSGVRRYGAPLKTFGGKASGPAPLVGTTRGIVAILNDVYESGLESGSPRRISGLEAMSIDHEIAQAVVAGGTRRSARMAMMHWRDPDIFAFIACKSDQSKHWSTNISVEIDSDFAQAVAAGDPHATRVLREVARGMALNGEPGLVDTGAHSADEPTPVRITNPCLTGDAWVQTSAGLRQIAQLVGSGPVELVVHDGRWSTTDAGFFKTGTKEILRIDVDGTPLRVTADHLVSTPDGWRHASELRPGDVVNCTDSLFVTWPGTGVDDDVDALPDLATDAEQIPDNVMAASSEQITSFLRRLFDAHGSVADDLDISLTGLSAGVLGQVRVLLLSLGVRSAVHAAGAGSHALVISDDQAERFSKVIGFSSNDKVAALDLALLTAPATEPSPMTGTVLSIVPDGVEDVYDCQVPCINSFVANGAVVHNCGEIGLQFDPEDAAGESCNLGSVDLARFATDDAGARRAFQLMARFLYRSTLNPHTDERVRRIELENRRIGVGIMGLQGWCAAHGVRLSELTDSAELQAKLESFRQAARHAADNLAASLGTPRSVKVTAVAPTGTIAQLSGTTPGVHPVMARYFIRRVRFANSDPQLAKYVAEGYAVLPDVYAANTSVVEFIVRDSILDRYPAELVEQADELTAAQFFDLIATVQRHFCGLGDGNAISATAQIAPDTDPDELIAAMRRHLGFLKGLTVFPRISRELAPYEPLTEVEFLERTAELGMTMVGDSNDGECAGGACPIR